MSQRIDQILIAIILLFLATIIFASNNEQYLPLQTRKECFPEQTFYLEIIGRLSLFV